ncbi:hypothetical protein EMIHUDRAFT_224184 [Emiliania huxleyi CCMP1516]|uniref:AP2/ERF domain-containing protein n=2 Tax=Emiliania huxleyi TaxID=2903 RepID=A0A0D3KSN9_EMIH1|nr:hypothetical protein EMIHUDRAFT_224184 [Emiliania huxleyi CCMP1516]EOD38774.1 hypothetical protein EMIHUDRAFT_224184 [Emiliania huxleyi CCMP1516]|eukprot:XP_005791203.1 hypothetical protein EMIHUDRAFT_224184 [Emiliania huxleyi CCMP1516]
MLSIRKDNTTGYKKCDLLPPSSKKFKAQVRDGGKMVHLGYFDTAEEAATAYARSECGRADAAKLLQPHPAPTAAGLEAIRQAEREGLTLVTSGSTSTSYKGVTFYPKERGSKKYKLQAVSQAGREGLSLATSGSNSGYKGVTFCPKQKGSKKYQLSVWVGGRQVFLGMFATAEEAALARAAGPSEASSVEEEDGFDPADIADAAVRAGAAAICVAPPCDDEVKAEVESYSEEESEMEDDSSDAHCDHLPPSHIVAQGHNELAYKCWYAQLDAYSNAATVILAGERRRHSVDSRIAMRRTACPDARLGALLWCRRKVSGGTLPIVRRCPKPGSY